MSTDRDVERIVRSWMDEGVTQLPDRVLDLVLDQIPATPQRRVPRLARMFSLTNNPLGLALAAAVVVALVLGISLLSRPRVGDNPQPTPTPRPSASPISLPGATWPLEPGTYSLPSFPLGIIFEVPAGLALDALIIHLTTSAVSFLFRPDHRVDLLTSDFLTTFSHLTHCYFNTVSYLATGLT